MPSEVSTAQRRSKWTLGVEQWCLSENGILTLASLPPIYPASKFDNQPNEYKNIVTEERWWVGESRHSGTVVRK
jgi:hypothetical protein